MRIYRWVQTFTWAANRPILASSTDVRSTPTHSDTSAVTGTRESSNTANQALYMMNNRFVIDSSDAFARRLIREYSANGERIEAAFELTYGRKPTLGERSAAIDFIKKFQAQGVSGQQTLSALCQSLFASAEFRYID
ncbi:MAG: DUF1553 domain-containing protein, partial [Fuerstiella sp.]|nr:DUF1553 domain-containing protein [Fuerstiella sp.]